MYRRPKFLEVLLEIRREMALEADYDVDLFTELARSGQRTSKHEYSIAAENGSKADSSVTVLKFPRRHAVAKK
jgi:hypothetical protein